MKLKEYLEHLNEMVRLEPELLELDIVYSKDDEGNGFEKVHYNPSLGYFIPEDNEFITQSAFSEWQENFDEELEVNAICLN